MPGRGRSFDLLAFVHFVSDLVHDVVAYHRERWDGSGYPW
jgi:HD-GYP domain-containing protein (c-di-GMP phosphodiesterase class II)